MGNRLKLKAWRQENKEKRNGYRKGNYAQTRPNARYAKKFWSDADVKKIFDPNRPPDRVLSLELGRSVEAIQVKRTKTDNPYV